MEEIDFVREVTNVVAHNKIGPDIVNLKIDFLKVLKKNDRTTVTPYDHDFVKCGPYKVAKPYQQIIPMD